MSEKTKKALAKSLKKLIKEKDVNKITIEEIATNAKVNRNTFYYHFNDIYNLIEFIYVEEIIEPLKALNIINDWKKLYMFIVDCVNNNERFILATYKLSSLNKFLYEQINTLVFRELDENVDDSIITKHEKEIMSKFYSWAFVGMIGNWINSGMKDNPKEIMIIMDKMMKIRSTNSK